MRTECLLNVLQRNSSIDMNNQNPIFIIDPYGRAVMFFPPDTDPKKILKDLKSTNLMNNIKNLSLFGVCFAFIVIALGAWTRLVDAGLGCPDWPGCYGFVVFPTDAAEIALAESRFPSFPYDINKAIPEVVHRYFAATLGFVAILLTYISFKYKGNKSLHWWSLGLVNFYMLPRPIWVFNCQSKAPPNYSDRAPLSEGFSH